MIGGRKSTSRRRTSATFSQASAANLRLKSFFFLVTMMKKKRRRLLRRSLSQPRMLRIPRPLEHPPRRSLPRPCSRNWNVEILSRIASAMPKRRLWHFRCNSKPHVWKLPPPRRKFVLSEMRKSMRRTAVLNSRRRIVHMPSIHPLASTWRRPVPPIFAVNCTRLCMTKRPCSLRFQLARHLSKLSRSSLHYDPVPPLRLRCPMVRPKKRFDSSNSGLSMVPAQHSRLLPHLL